MAKRIKKLGWGEGSVRQRGDRWQVRWREDGERRSLSGFESKAEAIEELEKVNARLKLGQPAVKLVEVPKVTGPRTIEKLVEEWVEYRVRHGRRMALEDRSRWKLHIAPALATQTLESISARWVRELAVSLVKPEPGTRAPDGTPKQPVSGPTAGRALTLLSSFLSWCVDEGRVATNAARVGLRHKDVKKLLTSKHDKDAMPYLKSWVEVMRLYRAIRDVSGTVSRAYLLSARAGLRPGETVALTWGDVDLDANTITVNKQVRNGKLGPPKSGKARIVPVGTELAKELAAWAKDRLTDKDTDLVCPPPHRTTLEGKRGSSYGKYLGPKSIRQALAEAFPKVKIKPATMYAYGRHTFGSLAALGGLPAWRLQAIMGHQDIKTTLRYVSLADQELTKNELRALGG
jgi:integrase